MEQVLYTCAITKKIFENPVLADDGFFYEEAAIIDHLKTNMTSPITGRSISDRLTKSHIFNFILSLYKEKIKARELSENSENADLIINQNETMEKEEKNGPVKFSINSHTHCEIVDFFKKSTDEKIKEVIDNMDLEETTKEEKQMINYVCRYGSPNMVKYIIDKGVELNHHDFYRAPIHEICVYQPPEIVEYIINKGADLEIENHKGYRPIHFICKYGSKELIKYIIDKGVNLEKGSSNTAPINIACKYQDLDTIKYMVEKGVDLECFDEWGFKPIHVVSQYQSMEAVRYLIGKGVCITDKFSDDLSFIDVIERKKDLQKYDYLVEEEDNPE